VAGKFWPRHDPWRGLLFGGPEPDYPKLRMARKSKIAEAGSSFLKQTKKQVLNDFCVRYKYLARSHDASLTISVPFLPTAFRICVEFSTV
jgi:hypothetical protein